MTIRNWAATAIGGMACTTDVTRAILQFSEVLTRCNSQKGANDELSCVWILRAKVLERSILLSCFFLDAPDLHQRERDAEHKMDKTRL